ncbi:MAG: magnesium-translocating P-type ATPase, partial [Chloroflexi bacterium]|nr:magnesium-translocating P-type ATPase [Chloroflexota bacterium]
MQNHASVDAYWQRTPEQLLAEQRSAPQGLSADEAAARLKTYGGNTIRAARRLSPLGMLLGQFIQPIMLILIAATLISGFSGEWVNAGIILAIVLGSALLSFFQEYSANQAAAKLRAQVQTRATVLRGGEEISILAEEVVPGDIVLLSAGSLIPADGILLEERDLHVNQAVLTGETYPAEKKVGAVPADASLAQRTNCVFMGTSVRSGNARALMIHTGMRTVFGGIADQLERRAPETEFERGVRRFGYFLTQVMLVLVLVIFAINMLLHRPVLDALLFSVALAVGLTPQMLPAIVSVTLAKGSQKMAARGVIVKRLAAIENFGSMDTLCTDKTGTLTEGVMRLDAALDTAGQPSEAVQRAAFFNASLQTGLPNALDEAIRSQKAFELGAVTKLDEVPYDFLRKRLSVAIEEKGARTLITKGALDNILEVCTLERSGGADVPLDDARRAEVQQRFADWSAQGYRVLGLAQRTLPAPPPYDRTAEHDMTLCGFLLFFDPPKQDVREVITSLGNLGVSLKIITGDNHLVAEHVADAVGLKVTGVLTGAQIADMSDDALLHLAETTTLFTEVDPQEKERIIVALRKRNHVVGYMGDGINDAPALHIADVGISVASAVDVAKEAADFVLLRQGLDVLHQGIEEGRRTFANTIKYVFITTSANFGNMFSMAGASLFLPFLPMLPLQILLTNFFTDFPALGIAADSVDPEMVQTPQRWNIRFIRRFMVTFGLVSSVFDYLTFGALLLMLHAAEAEFQTGWFVESTLTELLILLVIRTRRPFWKSKPARVVLVAVVAVALVT